MNKEYKKIHTCNIMGKSYFIIEIKSIKQGLKVLGQKENNTD